MQHSTTEHGQRQLVQEATEQPDAEIIEQDDLHQDLDTATMDQDSDGDTDLQELLEKYGLE